MMESESSFYDFGLSNKILQVLSDLEYKKPFPIQERCIPYLLSGSDVLGIAQTGSGKTAAFILPLLNNINPALTIPQVLILAPTRELAVQVGEVCVEFSKYMKGVNVVTIYGGEHYDVQFRILRKGPQIVVGTPGRLLDHLRRGTLNLSKLTAFVLDEADEMLRMGFIEDVKSILSNIPDKRQMVLFSATLPNEIRRIAYRFMNMPKEVYICSSGLAVCPDIQHSYCFVYGLRKIELLMRFLEIEQFDAAIVFVRTKNATIDVSDALEEHGYNSAALNGDMSQVLRKKTLERFKNGDLDILIATDIAARGLDVDRISLVINYDIPLDPKSYIHRVGRTGRAGRSGRALLFVDSREKKLLRNIERDIKITIPSVKYPPLTQVLACRFSKFVETVNNSLVDKDLTKYRKLLFKLKSKGNIDLETLAAVLLKIAQGDRPLILTSKSILRHYGVFRNFSSISNRNFVDQTSIFSSRKPNFKCKSNNMDIYRMEIGKDDGVKIRHIIGAISNKGDINVNYIGNIKLFSSYSIIELSQHIPRQALLHFNHARIFNKLVKIQFLGNSSKNMIHYCLHNNDKVVYQDNLKIKS